MTPFWDDRVADWVAHHIDGCERGFGQCRALGVHDGKNLVAGIVFHNWVPEDRVIEISSAATTPKWLTRGVMKTALTYAFDGLNCNIVVTRNHEGNNRARRIWRALGADEIIIPRIRNGAAEVVYTLSEDQWLASKFMRGH